MDHPSKAYIYSSVIVNMPLGSQKKTLVGTKKEKNYTRDQQAILEHHFTNPYGRISFLKRLPPETIALLGAEYSRSEEPMTDRFLKMLVEVKLGLKEKKLAYKDVSDQDKARVFHGIASAISSRGKRYKNYEQLLSTKATEFLKTWAIQYGHNSIRDLAKLCCSAEGVSIFVANCCLEEHQLQDSQEKSTRFVPFNSRDIIVPEVFQSDKALAARIVENRRLVMETYVRSQTHFFNFLAEKFPRSENISEAAWKKAVMTEALDNSRFLLPVGARTSLELTANARTFGAIVSKLLVSPIKEARDIGAEILAESQKTDTAGTLMKYINPNKFYSAFGPAVAPIAESINKKIELECAAEGKNNPNAIRNSARIVSITPNAENMLLAGLLYGSTSGQYATWESVLNAVSAMPLEDKKTIANQLLPLIKQKYPDPSDPSRLRDVIHIPFELLSAVRMIVEFTCDYGSFKDYNRQRNCDKRWKRFDNKLGYETPSLVIESSFESDYRRANDDTSKLYDLAAKIDLYEASLLLLQSFRIRGTINQSLGQKFYVTRLRTGAGRHFSYHDLTVEAADGLMKEMPLIEMIIKGLITERPPLSRLKEFKRLEMSQILAE